MGDHPPQTPRSPTLDLYGILGIPKTAALKDIGKAYKSLVTKWYTDKNSKPESEDKSTGRNHHQEDRISNCSDDPMTPMDNDLLHHHQQSLDDSWFLGPSFSSRTASTIASRRSRTPTPSPRCFSRTTSRRSITPTSRSRSGSQRGASETEFPAASLSRNTSRISETDIHSPMASLSRNMSRRSTTSTPRSRSRSRRGASETEFPAVSLSRNTSRISETDIHSSMASLSRNISRRSTTVTPRSRSTSRRGTSETEFPTVSLSRNTSRISETDIHSPMASLSRNMSRRCISETEIPEHLYSPSTHLNRRCSSETEIPVTPLSRTMSRKGTTTIIFSQTTVRRKPPPVEMKLECTLEDLCYGCVKKIKITREVITNVGILAEEEEILKIEVKPGWVKGTKITFEGKGDEKPGYLPADIVFAIDEKRHPLFRREGDDLEIGVEIPLVQALTGCSIPVPLLGGEKMILSFDNIIIYPGYEKAIPGQGMPNPRMDGRRGDLKIKFLIDFPTKLSDEERQEAVSILQDCS